MEHGVLGEAIRAERLRKHYSQEKLAELVGITPTHMKHIESEHRKPSLDVLFRLVRTLHLSLDDLCFPENDNNAAMYRRVARLLRSCDERQLYVVYTLVEALLETAGEA